MTVVQWLGIHCVAVVASVIMLATILSKKGNEYRNYLCLTSVCCIVALTSKCFGIVGVEYREMLIALKMEYLGKCFAIFFSLLFIIRFRNKKVPGWVIWILFFINSAMCVIIMTCEHHKLYYTFIAVERKTFGSQLLVGKAPLYYCYMGFTICEIVVFMVLCFRAWRKTKDNDARKSAYLQLCYAGVAPVVLLSFQCLGIIKGLDMVPLGIFLSVLFSTRAVNKYRLFDVIDNVKSYLLDNIEEGILVYDRRFCLIYANPYAETLMKKPEIEKYVYSVSEKTLMGEKEQKVWGDKVYELSASSLREGRNTYYVLRGIDVTDIAKQAQEMKELKEKAEEANRSKSVFVSNLSHEIRTPMNAIVGMTEILLRDQFNEQQTEYLMNIQSSGEALVSIINDILDFSKLESGKFELVETEYEPKQLFSDLGMIFLTRIGEKNLELIFDIDPNLPEKLYGDVKHIRQIIINLVNNAIKYSEKGYVKLKVGIVDISGEDMQIVISVKDSGIGIKKEDMEKLFVSFQRVDMKKNSNTEGTGLGLSICKQLAEIMGGSIQVKSEYGKGSQFFVTIHQKMVGDGKKKAVTLNLENQKKIISGKFSNPYVLGALKELCKQYDILFLEYEAVVEEEIAVSYFFTDGSNYELVKDSIPEDTEMILLHDPTQDFEKKVTCKVVNKPLYSMNFCGVLNNERQEVRSASEGAIDFVAPKARILIVDDNQMNRQVAVGLIRPLNMQVDTADRGQKALHMVQENHYDLVFMDHMMPEMDGIEATERIRQMEDPYLKEMPIIALTANAIVGAKEEFLQAGMNDFVGKPIAMPDMIRAIRRWLPPELIEEKGIEEEVETSSEEKESNRLQEIAKEIVESADLFDLDRLEELSQELSDFENVDEKKEVIQKLQDAIAGIDMEEVAKLAGEL